MSHDATKVLLGATQSSMKHVDNFAGDIPAGKIVRLKSDGTIVLTKADGEALGISLGKSLSDTSRTAVCRSGLRVPILLTAGLTPTVGTQVSVDDVTGIAKAAGAGVTAVNAVYATSKLISINEDGTETADNVALIDMPGGL